MKIYYEYSREDLNSYFPIEHSMVRSVENIPEWFKKTLPYAYESNTLNQLLDKIGLSRYNSLRSKFTIKKCPGLLDMYTHSVLLKFPSDVIIETKSTGQLIYNVATTGIDVGIHDESQSPNYLGEKYITVKFLYDFTFGFSEKVKYSFINPLYWKDQPYTVAPGMVQVSKNGAFPPNVITLFPKEDNRYFFKAGDPLALIQFDKKVEKIVKKTGIVDKEMKRRYSYNKFTNNYKR
jgi:hypothetical protein